jgi:crossover junction endodeoxyribonuclease RuvC
VKRWIGIDPGLSGAIAVLTDEAAVDLFDMPTYEKEGHRHLYIPDLLAILNDLNAVQLVAIERQSVRPTNARNRILKTGFGEGVLVGVVATLLLPYERVTPQVWQRAAIGHTTPDKGAHIERASQLYPTAELGARKDAGRADALLLAHYAKLQFP